MINKQGFTLIEVSIVSFILVILGAGVIGLRILLLQNESSAFNTYLNVSQANQIVSEFVNEVRKAQASDNGSFALETLNNFEIVFYSDIDFDQSAERIRYTLNGETLEKGIVEPTGNPATYQVANERVKSVSSDIKNSTTPLFFYYNDNWPEDTTNNPLTQAVRLSDTQLIRIFLVVNSNPNNPTEDYALDSFVQPRILKNNL